MTVDIQDIEKVAPVAESIADAITQWIDENNAPATLLNESEKEEDELIDLTLGIELTFKKPRQLKGPLSFLYSLAKEHKLDFVLGLIDAKTGDHEEICYFGHEEGRPDMFEVGNYLGFGD